MEPSPSAVSDAWWENIRLNGTNDDYFMNFRFSRADFNRVAPYNWCTATGSTPRGDRHWLAAMVLKRLAGGGTYANVMGQVGRGARSTHVALFNGWLDWLCISCATSRPFETCWTYFQTAGNIRRN